MKRAITLLFVAGSLVLGGCSTTSSQMSGVVLNCLFEHDRYELSLGKTSSSDYFLLDAPVVFALQGPVAVQKGSPAERHFADKYIGKTLHVSGEVQRDNSGRRFIHVTKMEQIEFR